MDQMRKVGLIKRAMGLCLAMMILCTLLPAGGEGLDAAIYGVTRLNGTVNLRVAATQSSRRVAVLEPGTWFTLLGQKGAWYQIITQAGETGYVSKNYVTLPQDQMAQLGVVTNPGASSFLNLRETPSYQGKVLGIYYNGTPALVLSINDGWALVQVGERTGYFRAEYLEMYPAVASSDVATVVTPQQTPMNLRLGPGRNTQILMQYPGGTYVMILQRGRGWYRVSVNGVIGFMDASFLQAGILPPRGGVSPVPPSPAGDAIVTNPRPRQVLNMRAQPSLAATILLQLTNGTRLQMVEQGLEWCKVSQGDQVGYVMTAYLTLHNLPQEPMKTIFHPKKSFVNLRSKAGLTTGRVILRMPHGSQVTVLIPGDQWVYVQYQGKTGYVAKGFLK